MRSDEPPAGNAATSRSGLVGNACACTFAAAHAATAITMPFISILSRLLFRPRASPHCAARCDRPQRLDAPVANAYVLVVKIHRRVAMAGNEFQLVAQHVP